MPLCPKQLKIPVMQSTSEDSLKIFADLPFVSSDFEDRRVDVSFSKEPGQMNMHLQNSSNLGQAMSHLTLSLPHNSSEDKDQTKGLPLRRAVRD